MLQTLEQRAFFLASMPAAEGTPLDDSEWKQRFDEKFEQLKRDVLEAAAKYLEMRAGRRKEWGARLSAWLNEHVKRPLPENWRDELDAFLDDLATLGVNVPPAERAKLQRWFARHAHRRGNLPPGDPFLEHLVAHTKAVITPIGVSGLPANGESPVVQIDPGSTAIAGTNPIPRQRPPESVDHGSPANGTLPTAPVQSEGVDQAGSDQSEPVAPQLPNGAPDEPGNLGELPNEAAARRQTFFKNIARGRAFNRERRPEYDYNELYVESGTPGKYYILDSYNLERREIVSRKATQLASIDPATAHNYLKEFVKKYPPGATIAAVPSTPENLRRRRLDGQMILEVPVQERPVPEWILKEAAKLDIQIRDSNGRVY